jgi:hypothetical protein
MSLSLSLSDITYHIFIMKGIPAAQVFSTHQQGALLAMEMLRYNEMDQETCCWIHMSRLTDGTRSSTFMALLNLICWLVLHCVFMRRGLVEPAWDKSKQEKMPFVQTGWWQQLTQVPQNCFLSLTLFCADFIVVSSRHRSCAESVVHRLLFDATGNCSSALKTTVNKKPGQWADWGFSWIRSSQWCKAVNGNSAL